MNTVLLRMFITLSSISQLFLVAELDFFKSQIVNKFICGTKSLLFLVQVDGFSGELVCYGSNVDKIALRVSQK